MNVARERGLGPEDHRHLAQTQVFRIEKGGLGQKRLRSPEFATIWPKPRFLAPDEFTAIWPERGA